MQLYERAAVRVKQVLVETLWHSDCFNTARLYLQFIHRRNPSQPYRMKANPVESDSRQRYAVSQFPETGKRAGGILDREHEPAGIETFLGALQ
jgi:hypothetical protein